MDNYLSLLCPGHYEVDPQGLHGWFSLFSGCCLGVPMEASARDWDVGESELRVSTLKRACILVGVNLKCQLPPYPEVHAQETRSTCRRSHSLLYQSTHGRNLFLFFSEPWISKLGNLVPEKKCFFSVYCSLSFSFRWPNFH